MALDRARLGDERQVGRQGTVLRGARLHVVLVGADDRIGEARQAVDGVALVVELARDLVRPGGGERLDRRLGEFRSARLGEIAEAHALQSVAGGADLLVDLKAALQLRLVVLAGEAAERPILPFDGVLFAALVGSARRQCDGGERQCPTTATAIARPFEVAARHMGPGRFMRAPCQALADASLAVCFVPSTASVIDPGTLSGVSSQPTSGMTTRKCAK